mmetsp:Transcript_14113/g.46357  ORF Transcript_14113/g.46357 Transcript_14113/m.46357 type:complete len:305 (-) Transcript_14113:1158-2072(-)
MTSAASCSSGRNSWSGGSKSRIVTGRPDMALKMPAKSLRWKGSISSRAARRASGVGAITIRRIASNRSSEANHWCSVRTSPMPSAPLVRAALASAGVSALASTLSARCSSTRAMNVSSSVEATGGASGTRPRITAPVVPSTESQSPSLTSSPEAVVTTPRASSMTSSAQPVTQHFPQPRATTAAWDVIPPRAVTTASAACMPPTSSGDVSTRTSTAGLPCAFSASACSELKTTIPHAAPGDAGSPCARRTLSCCASFSNCGCIMLSRCCGSTSMTALSGLQIPSAARSHAILTAAAPVRFPERH